MLDFFCDLGRFLVGLVRLVCRRTGRAVYVPAPFVYREPRVSLRAAYKVCLN